jgi:lipoate-protein ligase B
VTADWKTGTAAGEVGAAVREAFTSPAPNSSQAAVSADTNTDSCQGTASAVPKSGLASGDLAPEVSGSIEQNFTGHRPSATNPCLTIDLGLIPYADAYNLQQRIVAARKANLISDVLLLCEHPHVITQGRSGKREHLLASEHVLRQKGVEYFETHRGGDITYHGPGQIVGYPVIHLAAIRRDVVWYVRMLEEAMIRATRVVGIEAIREPGKTGIWVNAAEQAQSANSATSSLTARHSFTPSEGPLACPEQRGASVEVRRATSEKLGAIGVHISRWVTSHGFAYNVSTDLRYFDLIVPCGIADRKATSLEKLLQRTVALSEVKPLLASEVCVVLGREPVTHSPAELYNLLEEAESSSLLGHACLTQAVHRVPSDANANSQTCTTDNATEYP